MPSTGGIRSSRGISWLSGGIALAGLVWRVAPAYATIKTGFLCSMAQPGCFANYDCFTANAVCQDGYTPARKKKGDAVAFRVCASVPCEQCDEQIVVCYREKYFPSLGCSGASCLELTNSTPGCF